MFITLLAVAIIAISIPGNRVCGDINWNGSNWARGCDFNGNDLTNAQIKGKDCGGRCYSTPDCTHFTWNNFNGGTCWMKQNRVSKSDAFESSDRSSVCGIIHESSNIAWNGNNWARGCDFNGNDLSNAQIRGEDCGGRCYSTSGCTHFTWNNFNGGTCWMKQNAVSKDDAFKSSDKSSVCGVIDNFSTGQSGHSTRYWDCCKPSCAWNGTASVTRPVETCSADGYSVLHMDSQSGCSGGLAYICNNNIPWEITSDLSYGFAAANIAGKSEKDWCCSCYELTFTSGPVNGKRMIVQVTNTGADLGENHFDIQIPGGGVGIFNGCSSQWRAPDQGWGDRYGGVQNKQECDQLPFQIREGCKCVFNGLRMPTIQI